MSVRGTHRTTTPPWHPSPYAECRNDFIDTADVYPKGESEVIAGKRGEPPALPRRRWMDLYQVHRPDPDT